MRYSEILLESNKSEFIAKQLGIKLVAARQRDVFAKQTEDPLEIANELEAIDPSKGKYLQWLANRYTEIDFRMEDANRIRQTLQQFIAKRNSLEIKDINQYKSLDDLENAVEDKEAAKSKRQQKLEIKNEGVTKILETDTYLIMHLKTQEAANYYGKNTKWCTTADNDNMFNDYNRLGKIYIIIDKKQNRKWQLHLETEQFMDEHDNEVSDVDVRNMIEDPKINNWLKFKVTRPGERYYLVPPNLYTEEEVIKTNTLQLALDFALLTYKDKSKLHPQIKELIGRNFSTAFIYANKTRKPFPEGEDAIATVSSYAFEYATEILKGRFPKGEKEMARDLSTTKCIEYARLIKKRFKQAEHRILKDPFDAVIYAERVIKGRWPEAEKIIATNMTSALNYAQNVIKGRWPEGEDVIAQSGPFVEVYCNINDECRQAMIDRGIDDKWTKRIYNRR